MKVHEWLGIVAAALLFGFVVGMSLPAAPVLDRSGNLYRLPGCPEDAVEFTYVTPQGIRGGCVPVDDLAPEFFEQTRNLRVEGSADGQE